MSAQPFLSGAIGQRGDALLHLYRVTQIDALVRQGILYSRWAPDMGFGFGIPLFNYYAPLLYGLAEVFSLAGFAQVASTAMAMTLIFVLAAVGAYTWCSDLFGDIAGIACSVAYALSPYLLGNAFGRGAFAESLALAILPWTLWAALRLARNQKGGIALTAASVAAMLLSHNISALLGLPLAAAYTAISVSTGRAGGRSRTMLRLGLALALGLGLAAFFWAPAFLERDLVHIERTFEPTWAAYFNNFVSPGAIISMPFTADPRLISDSYPMGLSPLSALALASLLVFTRRGSGAPKAQTAILAIGAALCVWMATAGSQFVWERLTLLQFVQFPWRFLGIATLLLAALAGLGVSMMGTILRTAGGQSALLAAWLTLSAAFAFHRQVLRAPIDGGSSFSARDIARFEQRTSLFGTTSGQEYTPRVVRVTPPATASRWAFDGAWWDTRGLPPGARASGAVDRPLSHRLSIVTPEPTTLILRVFAFEGWVATRNGGPLPITPIDPYGLISVALPSGASDLAIDFGATPLRSAAEAASASTLALCGILAIAARRRPRAVEEEEHQPAPAAFGRRQVSALCACALGLLLVKQVYIDHADTVFIASRFDGVAIPGARWPGGPVFGDQLALLGVDGSSSARGGEKLRLTAYWRVTRALEVELSSSAQLINGNGVTVAQSDNFSIGNLATFYWQTGEYARDEHALAIPPNQPPGVYTVRWVVYPRDQPLNQLPPGPVGGGLPTSIEILP